MMILQFRCPIFINLQHTHKKKKSVLRKKENSPPNISFFPEIYEHHLKLHTIAGEHILMMYNIIFLCERGEETLIISILKCFATKYK